MILKRLGCLAVRDGMTLVEVADGDGVDHDIFLAKPVQSRAPGIGVIFAVGENHDGPAFGVLFGTESLAGRVEGRTEVGPPRPHDAGPQPVQRIEYGTEVFRQRTPDDPAAGERHHSHAVARFTRQSDPPGSRPPQPPQPGDWEPRLRLPCSD